MKEFELIRVDHKTYKVLKERKAKTGVPMAKQIKFHVLGKQAKIKVRLL